MHVAWGLEDLPRSDQPVFVVVGVFDGLHLGHAYLLHVLVVEAARRHARPVVVTFDHHPDEVITGSAPPLLCSPDERLRLLEAAGVDTTVIVHFDKRLRETPFEAFVAAIADRAPLAGFLMTPDAAFGFERLGTPAALAALGAGRGFDVVVVPPFELDARPVRSSEVREAIGAGDVAGAARLLGRPYAVEGEPADEGGRAVLRPGVPHAMPPAGRYETDMTTGDGPPRSATVSVEGQAIELPPGVDGTSVRVAFRSPVDPATAGM